MPNSSATRTPRRTVVLTRQPSWPRISPPSFFTAVNVPRNSLVVAVPLLDRNEGGHAGQGERGRRTVLELARPLTSNGFQPSRDIRMRIDLDLHPLGGSGGVGEAREDEVVDPTCLVPGPIAEIGRIEKNELSRTDPVRELRRAAILPDGYGAEPHGVLRADHMEGVDHNYTSSGPIPPDHSHL